MYRIMSKEWAYTCIELVSNCEAHKLFILYVIYYMFNVSDGGKSTQVWIS